MPDEDEFVEASLVAANKVYEVQEDSLVPVPDSWGQMPKIEILQSDKVCACYLQVSPGSYFITLYRDDDMILLTCRKYLCQSVS